MRSAQPRAAIPRHCRALPDTNYLYGRAASSQEQAALTARQLQPILTADDNGWSIRDDGAGSDTGTVKLGAPAKAKPLGHGCM